MLPPRDETWDAVEKTPEGWDVVVIGGGITGAGVFREAVRLGLRALLVEQRDFASGTSSRSSKLVHGGLRYLKEGRLLLTRESVLERQHLLQHSQQLVTPLPFLMPTWRGRKPGRAALGAGLALYDLIGGRWNHRHLSAAQTLQLAPGLEAEGLTGGWRYLDAQVDDARLVLRLIFEAVGGGGSALSYAGAGKPRRRSGRFAVEIEDEAGERHVELIARTVVNATGAWADRLHDLAPALRPLRGSHLMFPRQRAPIDLAITFPHPDDRRPVFLLPWEGAVLFGTTDLDHREALDLEPRIDEAEVAYLFAALDAFLPGLALERHDVLSTWAGVRPVVDTGKDVAPSRASRDHLIVDDRGLLTLTGGKLTTFRRMAFAALRRLRPYLGGTPRVDPHRPVFDPVEALTSPLDPAQKRRLRGRYGSGAEKLGANARHDEFERIRGTETLWAELRWAAQAEGVVHLEDLMLRRTRLGWLLDRGGEAQMERIREVCQPSLGWTDERWEEEEKAYFELWRSAYAPGAG